MSAFIGAGIVSVAPWSYTTAFDSLTFVDVGNVSKLVPSFSEDRKTLKNFRNAAGGNYASYSRVDTAELTIDFRDLSAANLALALWGEKTTAAGHTTIEALLNSAPLVAIKYVSKNLVDGKAWIGKFHKVRLGAPQGLDLISEDFANMSITGIMEADEKITAPNESQYFSLKLED